MILNFSGNDFFFLIFYILILLSHRVRLGTRPVGPISFDDRIRVLNSYPDYHTHVHTIF